MVIEILCCLAAIDHIANLGRIFLEGTEEMLNAILAPVLGAKVSGNG